MRGNHDSYTGQHRPRHTYFREGQLIGGINGGVILLQPDQGVFDAMMESLHKNQFQTAGRGAEQDFWSWWFAGEILGLPRKYNFQVHQLCVAAQTASSESEWGRLINDPDQVVIWHFSADPKPSAQLCGDTANVRWRDVDMSLFSAPWARERYVQRFITDLVTRKWIPQTNGLTGKVFSQAASEYASSVNTVYPELVGMMQWLSEELGAADGRCIGCNKDILECHSESACHWLFNCSVVAGLWPLDVKKNPFRFPHGQIANSTQGTLDYMEAMGMAIDNWIQKVEPRIQAPWVAIAPKQQDVRKNNKNRIRTAKRKADRMQKCQLKMARTSYTAGA